MILKIHLYAYVNRCMNAHTHTHARTRAHTHTHTQSPNVHALMPYSGLLFEEENLHELSHSELLRGKIFRTVRNTY